MTPPNTCSNVSNSGLAYINPRNRAQNYRLNLDQIFCDTIGFDSFQGVLEQRMQGDIVSKYPPYNIDLISDGAYRITMALAGFKRENLTVNHDKIAKLLSITGTQPSLGDEKDIPCYRGISQKSFDRTFRLADHVKVSFAKFEDGLLIIELSQKIPKSDQPCAIKIG